MPSNQSDILSSVESVHHMRWPSFLEILSGYPPFPSVRPFSIYRCSTAVMLHIEKAVWKLGQNGRSTEAKIYYYRFVYTSTFFSNGRISETKQDFLNALVPKFSYRRGLSSTLSWKWCSATLSPSFGLFQPERALYRGKHSIFFLHHQ